MKMNKEAVVEVAPLEDAADAHAKEIVYNNNRQRLPSKGPTLTYPQRRARSHEAANNNRNQ